jgi:CRP-like cAMP-binding protein
MSSDTTTDIVEQLRRVPLFASCPSADLDTIAALARPMAVEASTEIVHEGAGDVNKFFVISSGHVRVSKRMRAVAELGPGDVFGELALLVDRPRACTVLARTDCELLTFDRRAFRDALEHTPTVGLRLAEALAERLCTLEDDVL